MAVMEAYFDASESGGFLGIGGYLFRKKDISPFEKKWRAILRKHGLAYFHMTDCNATPPQGPFSGKGKPDCDDAARMAIAAIKEFAVQGLSSAIRPNEFDQIIGRSGLMTNPFSTCVYAVIGQCTAWARDNDPSARIVYVFEAGDDHQADANKILQSIADNPDRRAFFNYENHAFVPKRSSLPTQAADILAWHVCKQWDRRERKIEKLRGDFTELVENIPTREDLWTAERVREMCEAVRQGAPSHFIDPERVAGLALRATHENVKSINREIAALIRDEGGKV